MQLDSVEVEWRNIQKNEYLEELLEIGGKRQVPFLVIEGESLYESAAIIQKLKTLQ